MKVQIKAFYSEVTTYITCYGLPMGHIKFASKAALWAAERRAGLIEGDHFELIGKEPATWIHVVSKGKIINTIC